MVYIKEAHALDSMAPSSFEGIEDPTNASERAEVCVRCVDDLGIPIPALLDDMQDSVNAAYGAWPDRLYLVAKSGVIAYAGETGPRGFKPDELEAAIVEELANPRRPKSSLMEALDANGDGKLSAEEIAKAPERLKALDKNGDGEVSAEELGQAPEPQGREPAGESGTREMLQRLDADGDGKVSRAELPERARAMFERMDADKSGFLEGEELAAMARRRGASGRRGGDR